MNDLNIKGVDISNYQGIFDFNLLVANGIEVCIIESGDGITFTNPYLEQQYTNSKKAGLKVGFYHFFRAEDDCLAQVQAFWNRIKDKEFEIYPILDVEVTMGVENISQSVMNFIEEFKKISGYECIIYTCVNFANTNLNEDLSNYNCWIADYGVNSIPNTILKKYVGWQYTDNGKISGLSNQFDFDKFNSQIFLNTSSYTVQNKTKIESLNNMPLWKKCIHGQIIKNLQYELDSQFNSNLVIDGWFGDLTLNECVDIYFGAQGNITKIMQERLISKGFSCGVCGADGVYGEDTKKALREFQSSNELVVDEICGKNTWKALMLLK